MCCGKILLSVVFVEGRRDGRTDGRVRVVSGRVDRRRQRRSCGVATLHCDRTAVYEQQTSEQLPLNGESYFRVAFSWRLTRAHLEGLFIIVSLTTSGIFRYVLCILRICGRVCISCIF